jgi:hypothetical protein
MGGLALIGAIAFDPTIRGVLVVVVSTTVLLGSIFMILATNSGVRVGFLVAASGFFAWMFLMGSIWVIYGIGLKGRDPAWMPTDINYSRTTAHAGCSRDRQAAGRGVAARSRDAPRGAAAHLGAHPGR